MEEPVLLGRVVTEEVAHGAASGFAATGPSLYSAAGSSLALSATAGSAPEPEPDPEPRSRQVIALALHRRIDRLRELDRIVVRGERFLFLAELLQHVRFEERARRVVRCDLAARVDRDLRLRVALEIEQGLRLRVPGQRVGLAQILDHGELLELLRVALLARVDLDERATRGNGGRVQSDLLLEEALGLRRVTSLLHERPERVVGERDERLVGERRLEHGLRLLGVPAQHEREPVHALHRRVLREHRAGAKRLDRESIDVAGEEQRLEVGNPRGRQVRIHLRRLLELLDPQLRIAHREVDAPERRQDLRRARRTERLHDLERLLRVVRLHQDLPVQHPQVGEVGLLLEGRLRALTRLLRIAFLERLPRLLHLREERQPRLRVPEARLRRVRSRRRRGHVAERGELLEPIARHRRGLAHALGGDHLQHHRVELLVHALCDRGLLLRHVCHLGAIDLPVELPLRREQQLVVLVDDRPLRRPAVVAERVEALQVDAVARGDRAGSEQRRTEIRCRPLPRVASLPRARRSSARDRRGSRRRRPSASPSHPAGGRSSGCASSRRRAAPRASPRRASRAPRHGPPRGRSRCCRARRSPSGARRSGPTTWSTQATSAR